MTSIACGSGFLNTSRDYGGVLNRSYEYCGRAGDIGPWLDVLVFLAAFVGRSWNVWIEPDGQHWGVTYRYPVTP
jgi:hypothetical protein